MSKLHEWGRLQRSTGLRMTNLVSWPREKRREELSSGAKSFIDSGERGVGKQVVMFSSAMTTESTVECGAHKKLERVSPCVL
jgi:hypothetical protein